MVWFLYLCLETLQRVQFLVVFFYCFVKKKKKKKIGEVKLTITFEPNMRFEWDKKHIKEQNLPFYLKTTPKKPFTYIIW